MLDSRFDLPIWFLSIFWQGNGFGRRTGAKGPQTPNKCLPGLAYWMELLGQLLSRYHVLFEITF